MPEDNYSARVSSNANATVHSERASTQECKCGARPMNAFRVSGTRQQILRQYREQLRERKELSQPGNLETQKRTAQ
jgi:hypothetical protein